jgi:hypothetical protein
MAEELAVNPYKICPDDYQGLKTQCTELVGSIQENFYYLAVRLKVIKDQELYKADGYEDFKAFINNELMISKKTAYDFINLVEVFGEKTLTLNNPTKLIPAINILKSKDIPEERKSEIKEKILNQSDSQSYEELREEMNEIRATYSPKVDSERHRSPLENIKRQTERLSLEELMELQDYIERLRELMSR